MISYETALVLAIGAVIASTVFRTFLPYTTKLMAEIQLASKEGRDPVFPKMLWIWWVGAGINIIIVGFPILATIDQLVQPILKVTSPVVAFFIVWGLAQSALEVVFRMMDSGVDSSKDSRPIRVVSPAAANEANAAAITVEPKNTKQKISSKHML
jgi:hypothetical protein